MTMPPPAALRPMGLMGLTMGDACGIGPEIIAKLFRMPGAAGNATLSVATPVGGLVNAGGDTIPFSQIRWVSSGIGDTGAEVIPSGTFTGGTQTLASLPVNTWNESCHTFSYLNATVVAAGTYTGRAIYTLSAP